MIPYSHFTILIAANPSWSTPGPPSVSSRPRRRSWHHSPRTRAFSRPRTTPRSWPLVGGPFLSSWQVHAIRGRSSWPRCRGLWSGPDFPRHLGLLVDVRCSRAHPSGYRFHLVPFLGLLEGNPNNFGGAAMESIHLPLRDDYPTFTDKAVKHSVMLPIPTTGPPVLAKARRLPPDKLALAKKAFQTMLDAGIVRRSDSAWSSPLYLVKKDDRSWRPCGDFHHLNSRTTADKYPVPHLQDFSAQLHGFEFFSKIDLVRGYHQIPVAPEDIHKTAVITPFGLFEFLRTPFGLKNAVQAFQWLMDTICQGLSFALVYLDDILVASRSKEEHRNHLQQLFDRLQAAGLILNLEKCLFGKPSLCFLGHDVTTDGIAPTADSIKAITDFPALRPSSSWSASASYGDRTAPGLHLSTLSRRMTDRGVPAGISATSIHGQRPTNIPSHTCKISRLSCTGVSFSRKLTSSVDIIRSP